MSIVSEMFQRPKKVFEHFRFLITKNMLNLFVLALDLTSVLSDAIMPPNENTKGKYRFLYNAKDGFIF